MTKVTYTPGPWIIHKREGSSHLRFISRTYSPFPIARVEPVPVAYELTENIEANARLIAAAPDLLEACETALDFFEPDQAVGVMLQVAIAKAKGEA